LLLPKHLPKLRLRPLPVVLPIMGNWDELTQSAARSAVAERLRISETMVKTAPLETPNLVDADLLMRLEAFNPERIRILNRD
jgi:hypothetical protein